MITTLRASVVLLAAAALSVLLTPATPAGAWAALNNDRDFIQVYVNNIENLESTGADDCPGDWKDLIYYMKTYETSPDLFLVQQLAGPGELNTLLNMMNTTLAGEFKGILAVPDPEKQASPCDEEKDHQTNAIIWRVGRFDLVAGSKVTWQSSAERADGTCGLNSQDRTINVAARLWDKIAEKHVSVASIHWPTAKNGGPACAPENARRVVDKVEAIPAALRVWGGDTNVVDRSDGNWRGWYEQTNGQLGGRHGYKDAAFDDCSERGAGIPGCLADNHWTLAGPQTRIDFLFARKGAGGMPFMGAEHTVTFAEGNAAHEQVTDTNDDPLGYSGHRSVRARVHY